MKRIIVLPEELEELQGRLKKIESMLNREHRNIVDPILDSEKVMSLLNVSRRCLQNWRDQGIIQFSAVNGKFYYRMSAIEQMLTNHAQIKQNN